MSYTSPFECLDIFNFTSIVKKLVHKDADGNLWVNQYGIAEAGVQFITLTSGADEWRFGIDAAGHFTVDNNAPPWTTVFEV